MSRVPKGTARWRQPSEAEQMRYTTSEVCIGCLGPDQKAGYDVCEDCLHRLRFCHNMPGVDYRNDQESSSTFDFSAFRDERKRIIERRRRMMNDRQVSKF